MVIIRRSLADIGYNLRGIIIEILSDLLSLRSKTHIFLVFYKLVN